MIGKLFAQLHKDQETDPAFARTVIGLHVIALIALLAVIIVINTVSEMVYASQVLSLLFVFVAVSMITALRGYLIPGRLLVPLSLAAAITTIIYKGNGIHDTAVFGFPVVVLLGGMLAGRKGIWPFALFCMGSIAFVVFMEVNGAIKTPYSAVTGWDDALIHTALLATSASILSLLMKRMDDSLSRAQRNEKALRESEEKFSKAFRSSPTAILIVGLESGTVLEVNHSFETIFGYARSEVLGRKIYQISIYSDPQHNAAIKDALLKEGRIENWELPGRRSDGKMVDVRVSAELTEINGETCAISSLENITESKLIQTAMQRTVDMYRRAIIAAGAVPYYLDNRVRKYTFMGEGILQMTGYTASEMHPDLWATLEQERFPRGGLAHLTYEEADRLTEEDASIPWECDYRILTRDGQTRWVADTSVKGLNEFGEAAGVIGILQDITDRKLAELEREKLIEDLGTRNAELERFTYTVSHDLKSPLVTIKGYLGYINRDLSSGNTERVDKDIQRINDATERMHQLLNDLLELSRIGRMVNPPEQVSFADIVQEAVHNVTGQIQAGNIKLEIHPTFPIVRVDKARLVEVVQNLIDNACKYMGNQHEPFIEIGHQVIDGRSIFYVKDNGIGIEPQFQEKIFGLFNQLNPSSEGTGVGLALVKRIVELHGGTIWVESEGTGTGSKFCFTLEEKLNPDAGR